MNYTFHQLQIFLRISRLKSITKAAEDLHLTQPAVSIQLKNFQDQFPIPLTEVTGRKLYITDFGKEIAKTAEAIIEKANDINYKTLAYQGKLAGQLKITVASTGKYVMPYFLSDFLRENDGVELAMDVTNKTKVVRSMEANEVDFALVSVFPKKLKINNVPLMTNSLYLVGSDQFEFDSSLSKREIFENHPLIYRENGSATRYAMENFIAKNKFSVRKKMELTSNEAVKQAVIAGLGFSIMPLIGIKNTLKNKSLQIIPVKGLPLQTTWNLVWLKSKKLSPVATAYLDYVEKRKEAIISKHFSWIKEFDSKN
ncbi:MAG: LysR family transcriptional regulator [Leeuwenhoekiella sp.]